MSSNPVDQEGKNRVTPEVAEGIVRLGEIKVDNPNRQTREKFPIIPLFGQRQVINTKQFWGVLLNENPQFPEKQLNEVGQFLKHPETEQGIRDVHKQLVAVDEKHMTGGVWFTSLMLYPLIKNLSTLSPASFQGTFTEWCDDWLQGVDPEKFRMAFGIFFRLLSRAPRDTQEWYVPNLGDHPVQESEADFLTGIFERVYVGINDVDKINEADKRSRQLDQPTFSSDDLYHTTDLSTLPQIINKGLLATECTSLILEGFREANFGVSFWNLKEPPRALADLGEQLKSGEGVVRTLNHKVHLAFLDPKKTVDPSFILYPPESFWLNRATRTNRVAGRYISGYDSDGSTFGNKTIAYALIGIPSPATTFVMLDEKDKEEYAGKAKSFPFYLPAYSYDGQLLYKPEQYDK